MATKKYNMEELCVSFLVRNRYYTCFLAKMNKVATKTLTPTAGVGFTKEGKLCLYYNEAYFEDKPLNQAQAVLEHEILHITFKHLYRFDTNVDKNTFKMQNYATDMAINQYLNDLPEGAIYPETYGLPREMFAEWYLAELKKMAKEGGGKGGSGDGQGDSPDDQGLDDHSLWDKVIDEKGEAQPISGNEQIDREFEIDKIVRQAAKESENDPDFGKLPAGLQRELKSLRNPPKKFDWRRDLSIFCNTVLTCATRLSQKKVNRRFLEAVDYILPGVKKDRKPKLLIVRDTSGSVFDDDIQLQFAEQIVNIARRSKVILADCDTEIHDHYEVKKITDFKPYKGGGGTSFEPAFELARKLHADGIVYLTDTYGSFPQIKDIGKFASKTIWVTVNQDTVNVPFGKHVNIKEDSTAA